MVGGAERLGDAHRVANHVLVFLQLTRRAVAQQTGGLLPYLTVRENILAVLETRKDMNKSQRLELADDLLSEFSIQALADNAAISLSGGERRRLEIARALVTDPALIMLDEPFSAQDLQLRDRLLMLVKRHHEQHGLTTLIGTEDPRLALRMADRVAVLQEGRVEQVGTPRELYDRPASRQVASSLGRANLLDGEVEYAGEQPLFRTAGGIVIQLFERRLKRARQGWAMFRPHDLALVRHDDEPFGDTIRLTGRVSQVEFRGSTIWTRIGRRLLPVVFIAYSAGVLLLVLR